MIIHRFHVVCLFVSRLIHSGARLTDITFRGLFTLGLLTHATVSE